MTLSPGMGVVSNLLKLIVALAIMATIAALSASNAQAAEIVKKARFGEAATLRGFDSERILVRPYRIKRLATNEFDDRPLVGVSVSLKNTGRKLYSGSPSNGAEVVTTGNKVIDSTYSSDETCDGGSNLRVPRGQKRLICIAFEVSTDTQLRYFEFTLNSGFADMMGQWRGLPTF